MTTLSHGPVKVQESKLTKGILPESHFQVHLSNSKLRSAQRLFSRNDQAGGGYQCTTFECVDDCYRCQYGSYNQHSHAYSIANTQASAGQRRVDANACCANQHKRLNAGDLSTRTRTRQQSGAVLDHWRLPERLILFSFNVR